MVFPLPDKLQLPHSAREQGGPSDPLDGPLLLDKAGEMDRLSVEFCTAQAAQHLARAETCDLPNVKAIALAAAGAWMKEAESARRVLDRRARNATADLG